MAVVAIRYENIFLGTNPYTNNWWWLEMRVFKVVRMCAKLVRENRFSRKNGDFYMILNLYNWVIK